MPEHFNTQTRRGQYSRNNVYHSCLIIIFLKFPSNLHQYNQHEELLGVMILLRRGRSAAKCFSTIHYSHHFYPLRKSPLFILCHHTYLCNYSCNSLAVLLLQNFICNVLKNNWMRCTLQCQWSCTSHSFCFAASNLMSFPLPVIRR